MRHMRRQLMSGVWVMFASLAAQTHPDFSGTWTVDTAKSDPLPPPPARGRGPASVPANQIVIRQTADDVTMVRGPRNLTYHFDGTETFHFDAGEVRSTVA